MMFAKIAELFKGNKESEEQKFLNNYNIQYDESLGYSIDGFVLNDLSERLEYFSNRKLKKFDDLKELYFKTLQINEKIDLEIANQRYVERLGNTQENLIELKNYIAILNDYYRQFKREK